MAVLFKKMKRHLFFTVFLVLMSSLLFSQAGTLILDTNTAGADVRLNGRSRGRTLQDGSYEDVEIAPGSYDLELRKRGYQTFRQQIKIVEGVTAFMRIDMQPNPKQGSERIAENRTANILIDSNIGDAKIYLDGKYIGSTEREGRYLITDVTLGEHRIKLSKSRYKTVRSKIHVPVSSSGTTLRQSVTLHEKAGSGGAVIILVIVLVTLVVAALILTLFKIISSFKQIRGRFDNYIIKGLLGRGGMSTVYQADDLLKKQQVALKVMDDRFLQDQDMINKFQREGKGLSIINAKCPQAPVVKVYRYGRENSSAFGRPFIAMELLRGPSLLDCINNHKNLPLHFSVEVVKQVALALECAHQQKIYHRDVTPDNVIVIRNNFNSPLIKLIDFGVAKHEFTDVGTLDGTISGKPPYMSPEQCRGERVDGRSDVYSLGIIFYTLLSGHPPFSSKNPFEVMHSHEKEQPPNLPDNIPSAVKKVVMKMLEKRRTKRYQDMRELVVDLDNLRL